MQSLLVKYFSNHISHLVERLLLCGIVFTGILLLAVLTTLLFRYLSREKISSAKLKLRSAIISPTQNPNPNLNSNPNQIHTPVFFGIPNPELESEQTHPEEDWESLAIRNFNEHLNLNQQFNQHFNAPNLPSYLEENFEEHQTQIEQAELQYAPEKQTEISLKLDLAKTYLEIEDRQNASQLLKEVLQSQSGSLAEKKSAESLLATI